MRSAVDVETRSEPAVIASSVPRRAASTARVATTWRTVAAGLGTFGVVASAAVLASTDGTTHRGTAIAVFLASLAALRAGAHVPRKERS